MFHLCGSSLFERWASNNWLFLQFLMIIKGLFRRYKRWNPVHPTIGTFWGLGIGVGCGVGWGPGFGPEVIGYVGAGCGVGFSVGITLAGIGVGLPHNGPFQILYNGMSFSLSCFPKCNLPHRCCNLSLWICKNGNSWQFMVAFCNSICVTSKWSRDQYINLTQNSNSLSRAP